MAKKKDKDEEVIGEGVDGFLASMQKEYGEGFVSANNFLQRPRRIIPFSPSLDGIGCQIPEGSWATFAGKPKWGKEQPYYSIVYTPSGPVKMGDLKIGDFVSTPDGSSAKVLEVIENGEKDIYRVYFNDKTHVDCGLEHLWKVRARQQEQIKVLPLSKIKDDLLYHDRYKWSVEITKPVEYKGNDLDIDYYVIGILIGDGCLTHSGCQFANFDKELVGNVLGKLPVSYKIHSHKGLNSIQNVAEKYGNKYIKFLNENNLRKTAKHKHIPTKMLYSSIENRFELMRGLMDSDGTVNDRGNNASYSSISEELCNQVAELGRSLGYKCQVKLKNGTYKGERHISYRTSIAGNDLSKLFKVSRKMDRCKIRSKKDLLRYIVKVEKLERKEKCRCIYIDSKEHLYLTDNYTVTHNTSIALWFASKAQRPENGDKHIFYLNIEGRLKPMNLNGTKGLNPSKFTIIESTEDKIYSAQDYLNIGEKILLGNKKAVLIIDSYSAVAPEAELVGGVGTSTRGGNAVLLAQFTRQMANVVPVKGHIVIGITHLMANTSGYGSPYSEKGGQAIAYQVDVKLMAKKLEDWLEDGKQIGQIVTWESGCTATGAPPGQTCQTYIRYGMGIDEVAELSAIGQEFGLVGKAGAWYTLDFLEYHLDKIDETEWNDEVKRKYKYQGEAKLLAGLRANEEIQKLLYEEIKKLYEV